MGIVASQSRHAETKRGVRTRAQAESSVELHRVTPAANAGQRELFKLAAAISISSLDAEWTEGLLALVSCRRAIHLSRPERPQ